MIDITPAAERMTKLLAPVTEADLARPTPCPDMTIGDLVDHIRVFTEVFTAIARKAERPYAGPVPTPDAANLQPGWRERLHADLPALAEAWKDPSAWEGMTSAGGIDMPCEIAGLVVLDELVLHGWDVAVATAQPYDPAPADVEAATSFVTSFEAPRDGALFGPVVEVADDAPALDRLLGLAGRDPSWRPDAP